MKDIILEKPQVNLDFPLMKSLELRRTKRKWKNNPLSMQEVSNILWAACGETKQATKQSKNRRTIASACNSQLVSIYVALESGVYKYIESDHMLKFITSDDIRDKLGTQKMMKTVPFGLIYVADFYKKTGVMKSDDKHKMLLAGTESGSISQNVYLYCATANLNTVLIALVNRPPLLKALKLNENMIITYTQIVGKSI